MFENMSNSNKLQTYCVDLLFVYVYNLNVIKLKAFSRNFHNLHKNMSYF
ncbi:hypothetical protein BN1326_130031 [Staphylococcus argenteus]|uniref:Uncharacterized protein n=1 Tax=Staphylococcus argenteus TaxID=985002 RepID=A0A7U7JQQ1_9STAP|nr:hypothetical protein BN1326_130031 [Staphylococcus argenteus]CRI13269.1 hypothetical protein BN1326_130031 [Staphylococcus argenteus]